MAWFHSAPSPLSLITRHPSSFLWWLRFIATGKEDKEWHHLPMWTENGFKAMPGKRQCSLSSVFYLFKKIPSAIHSFQTGGGGRRRLYLLPAPSAPLQDYRYYLETFFGYWGWESNWRLAGRGQECCWTCLQGSEQTLPTKNDLATVLIGPRLRKPGLIQREGHRWNSVLNIPSTY